MIIFGRMALHRTGAISSEMAPVLPLQLFHFRYEGLTTETNSWHQSTMPLRIQRIRARFTRKLLPVVRVGNIDAIPIAQIDPAQQRIDRIRHSSDTDLQACSVFVGHASTLTWRTF